jgi:hypothetical protein
MVYISSFKETYKHARHYLCYTEDIEKRLSKHKTGTGTRMPYGLENAIIRFKIVRT